MNANSSARSNTLHGNAIDQKERITPMKSISRLAALLGCALAISAAPVQAQSVLSHSVTDFAYPAQGFNNWQYGYIRSDSPSLFQQYPTFSGGKWSGPVASAYSTYLDMYGGRTASPSSAVDVYPVRRWTSPFSGWVVISGDYAHASSFLSTLKTQADILLRPGGSGSAQSLLTFLISHQDNQVRNYQPILAKVKKGDVLDFMLSPYENDNDDVARFTAAVDKSVKPIIYLPARVPKNTLIHGFVWLPGAPTAQTGPINYSLTSSNAGVAKTTTFGPVPVGGQMRVFDLTTLNVSVPTTVKITAKFPALGNKTATISIQVMP